MDSIDNLKQYCIEKATQYPKLAGEIEDLYQLALDEIDQGGSPMHECELAIGSIEEAIDVYEDELASTPEHEKVFDKQCHDADKNYKDNLEN
jgi:hypothetical protein